MNEVPILPPVESSAKRQPHKQRTDLVFQLLDEAQSKGTNTYDDLVEYVRVKTGKGCSRKLVSRWKKERAETEATALKEKPGSDQKPSTFVDNPHGTEVFPDGTFSIQTNEGSERETEAEKTEVQDQPVQGKFSWLTFLKFPLKRLLFPAAAIGAGLLVVGQSLPSLGDRPVTTAAEQATVLTAPREGSANTPKTLKFSLSISSPEDLRVKQNDKVEAGQVLADRVEERSRLTAQREALNLEHQQIQSRIIPTPPPPVPVPPVAALPPISYAEEEAAIQTAQISVSQAERAFQLQQQKLKTPPTEESAAVQKATIMVEDKQRLVNNQKQKIAAVALLENVPKSVPIHEQEILKQKEAELKQAAAEYQQATAKLSAASQAEIEKLQQLGATLEKARAEFQVAIAKLQTKKDQRAYAEYEASITAARRAEEQNTAASNRSRQLLEAEQQQRDRSYQLAQVKAKINEVNNQLTALSVVTSPYKGVVKSVKIQRQTNSELSVELTLAINNNSTAAVSSSFSPNNTATTDQSVISIGSTVN